MAKVFSIATFRGDGIGPEIMEPTVRILEALASQQDAYGLDFSYVDAGALHYRETGEALPEASLAKASSCDAILLSAMGLPDIRYEDGTEISPQVDMRKELGLYAGVRPVAVSPGNTFSALKPFDKPVDFVLIRESTEGLFYSSGSGSVDDNEARETLLITREVSEKLFHFAFRLARQRKSDGRGAGRVTCVDKANIFRAFAFFRKVFNEVAEEYPDIDHDWMYVDAAALKMVKQPDDLDVLVTENMFGDILSDLGAGLMGGLGLAPSADIGDKTAVFQPCHGSAPDIAGRGLANPVAMILSAAMMLEWLGQRHSVTEMVADADRIRFAVASALCESANLTRDLGGTAGTDAVADALLERLA